VNVAVSSKTVRAPAESVTTFKENLNVRKNQIFSQAKKNFYKHYFDISLALYTQRLHS